MTETVPQKPGFRCGRDDPIAAATETVNWTVAVPPSERVAAGGILQVTVFFGDSQRTVMFEA